MLRQRPTRVARWQRKHDVETIVAERQYRSMRGSHSITSSQAHKLASRAGLQKRRSDLRLASPLPKSDPDFSTQRARVFCRPEKDVGRALVHAQDQEQEDAMRMRSVQFPLPAVPIRSARLAASRRRQRQSGSWFGNTCRWSGSQAIYPNPATLQATQPLDIDRGTIAKRMAPGAKVGNASTVPGPRMSEATFSGFRDTRLLNSAVRATSEEVGPGAYDLKHALVQYQPKHARLPATPSLGGGPMRHPPLVEALARRERPDSSFAGLGHFMTPPALPNDTGVRSRPGSSRLELDQNRTPPIVSANEGNRLAGSPPQYFRHQGRSLSAGLPYRIHATHGMQGRT